MEFSKTRDMRVAAAMSLLNETDVSFSEESTTIEDQDYAHSDDVQAWKMFVLNLTKQSNENVGKSTLDQSKVDDTNFTEKAEFQYPFQQKEIFFKPWFQEFLHQLRLGTTQRDPSIMPQRSQHHIKKDCALKMKNTLSNDVSGSLRKHHFLFKFRQYQRIKKARIDLEKSFTQANFSNVQVSVETPSTLPDKTSPFLCQYEDFTAKRIDMPRDTGNEREKYFVNLRELWKRYMKLETEQSDLERTGCTWTVETLLRHLSITCFKHFEGLTTFPSDSTCHRIQNALACIVYTLTDWNTCKFPEEPCLNQIISKSPTESDCRIIIDAIITNLCKEANLTFRSEKSISTRDLPRNRADYMFFDKCKRPCGLLEAKRADLAQGFVQACIQLICLQQLRSEEEMPLFAIVSDGYRYILLVLTTKEIFVEGPTVYAATTWNTLWYICSKIIAIMLKRFPNNLITHQNEMGSCNDSIASSNHQMIVCNNADHIHQNEKLPQILDDYLPFQLIKHNISPCKCQNTTKRCQPGQCILLQNIEGGGSRISCIQDDKRIHEAHQSANILEMSGATQMQTVQKASENTTACQSAMSFQEVAQELKNDAQQSIHISYSKKSLQTKALVSNKRDCLQSTPSLGESNSRSQDTSTYATKQRGTATLWCWQHEKEASSTQTKIHQDVNDPFGGLGSSIFTSEPRMKNISPFTRGRWICIVDVVDCIEKPYNERKNQFINLTTILNEVQKRSRRSNIAISYLNDMLDKAVERGWDPVVTFIHEALANSEKHRLAGTKQSTDSLKVISIYCCVRECTSIIQCLFRAFKSSPRITPVSTSALYMINRSVVASLPFG